MPQRVPRYISRWWRDHDRVRRWLFVGWVIAITVAIFLGFRENRHRIDEIQSSRENSCRATYEGIREVFEPLYPMPPRTPQQQEKIDIFNDQIDALKANCDKQTQSQR